MGEQQTYHRDTTLQRDLIQVLFPSISKVTPFTGPCDAYSQKGRWVLLKSWEFWTQGFFKGVNTGHVFLRYKSDLPYDLETLQQHG